jgi:hypothetical protein
MQTISKPQLITVNTLLSKLGLQARKTDIITGFTGGRSSSSRDMSFNEASALIQHLKGLDPQERKAEVMRRKIISMAHEMGWHLPGGNKIDMRRVDAWCLKYGYRHKKLDGYQYKDLPLLVTQFETGPYKHYISIL